MTILGLNISMAVFWLILAIIFLVIEAITVGLTTIWFAAGSFAGLLLSMAHAPIWLQFALFLAVSLCLLVFTRKIFVEKLKTGSESTNAEALIGEIGQVMSEIKPLETGQVRIKGQMWSAANKDEEHIAAGSFVKVIAIEGVKLIVIPEKDV